MSERMIHGKTHSMLEQERCYCGVAWPCPDADPAPDTSPSEELCYHGRVISCPECADDQRHNREAEADGVNACGMSHPCPEHSPHQKEKFLTETFLGVVTDALLDLAVRSALEKILTPALDATRQSGEQAGYLKGEARGLERAARECVQFSGVIPKADVFESAIRALKPAGPPR